MSLENQIKDKLIDTGIKSAHNLSSEVHNLLAKSYNEEFESLMAETCGVEKSELSSSVTMLGFEDRDQVLIFQELADSQGMEIHAAPIQLNGQWVVAVNNNTVEHEGKTITPFSLIDDFKNKYGDDIIQEVNTTEEQHQTAKSLSDIISFSPSEITNAVMSLDGMQEINTVYRATQEAINTLKPYDVDNVSIAFTKSILDVEAKDKQGNTLLNPETGEAILERQGTSHVNSSVYKSAIVLHDDTVLIDGKLITSDNPLREQILQEHQKRMEAASEIASGETPKNAQLKVKNIFLGEKDTQDEANKILESHYHQEYAVEGLFESEFENNKINQTVKDYNTAVNAAKIKYDLDVSSLTNEDMEIIKGTHAYSDIVSANGNISLSFNERKEIISAIKTFETTLFVMNYAQRNLMDSLLSEKNLKDALIKMNGQDKSILRATLKRFANNSKDVNTQAAITNFLKNGDKWLEDQARLDEINRRLKNINLSANKRDILEAQKNELEQRIKGYKINDTDLKKIFSSISDMDEINRSKLHNLKTVFDFKKEEKALEALASRDISGFLEKDFEGIITAGQEITADDIIKIQIETINRARDKKIPLVKNNGKLDVEALKNLSSLKLKELGISEATRNLILHENSGKDEFATGVLSGKLSGLAVKGIGKVAEQDEDLSQLYSNVRKTYKYSKNSVKFIRQNADNTRIAINKLRLRQAQRTGKEYKPIEKVLEDLNKRVAQKAGVQKLPGDKAYDRFIKSKTKSLTKYNSRPHRFFTKAEKAKQAALRSVAKTRLGRTVLRISNIPNMLFSKATALAVKAIPVVGGAFLILTGIICAFVVIYMLINSLADLLKGGKMDKFNALAPATFRESVAYNLYDVLKNDEDTWLNHLGDYKGAYNNRETLKYGESYEGFKQYAEKIVGLHWKDSDIASDGSSLKSGAKIYINPFYTKSGHSVIMSGGTKRDASWYENVTDGVDYEDVDESTYMTEVKAYDGINTINIGTNDNLNTQTEGRTYGGYIPNVDTGHTSNIKDIIAMTDIMYAMEMDSFYNLYATGTLGESPSGILGASPEQINYADKNSKTNWFGWAWRKLLNQTEEETYQDFKLAHNGKSAQSYNTILNYAQNLFDNSHTEQWYLDVDFFDFMFVRDDNGKMKLDSDGNPEFRKYKKDSSGKVVKDSSGNKIEEKLTIGSNEAEVTEQQVASQLGYCINPCVNKFKLEFLPNDDVLSDGTIRAKKGIHVYGEGKSGTKFETDTGIFPINIGFDNIVDKNDSCLHYKNELSSGGYTFPYLISNSESLLAVKENADSGSKCWSLKDYEVPSGVKQDLKTTRISDWCDSESDAIDNAKAKLEPAYNNAVANAWPDKNNIMDGRKVDSIVIPKFSPDKSLMTLDYQKILDKSDLEYETLSVTDKDVLDRVEYHLIFIRSDDSEWEVDSAVRGAHDYDGCEYNGSYWNYVKTYCFYYYTGYWYGDEWSDEAYDAVCDYYNIDANDRRYNGYRGQFLARATDYDYKKQYQVQLKMTYAKGLSDVYERNCQGHDFAYCGGHVGAHCHGTVYSATNEQMAMAGVQEQDITPTAEDFDLAANGYDALEGKIKEDADKSNLLTYLISGRSKPFSYTQGSYYGSLGPNLKTASGVWESGIDYSRLEKKGANLRAKDIFDIDMGTMYGDNVFPCSGQWEKYEGWTGSNMSLCLGRISAPWTDIYDFDIPLEIGDHINKSTVKTYSNGTKVKTVDPLWASTPTGHVVKNVLKDFLGFEFKANKEYYSTHLYNTALSTNDIALIDEALESTYGSDYTPERKEAVHRALGWVGRANAESYMGREMYTGVAGSYSLTHVGHDDHGFLGAAETSLTGDTYSCTSGNEVAFVNYLRYKNGATVSSFATPTTLLVASTSTAVSNDYSNVYPGDYILTTHKLDLNQMPVNEKSSGEISYDIDTIKYYSSDEGHAAVFIGYPNKSVTLSSGQVLSKNTPWYIDMNTLGQYTRYSRYLSYVQKGESDLFKAFDGIEVDPDKATASDNDALSKETIFGVAEFQNGARNIGGVYLHGSKTTQYWLRKNRTIAYWVANPELCNVKKLNYDS